MADDDTPDDDAPQNPESDTPPASEAAPQPRLFTQEEVDSIVKTAKSKAKRSAARPPQNANPEFDTNVILEAVQAGLAPLTSQVQTLQGKLDARDAVDSASKFDSLFAAASIPEGQKELVQLKWNAEKPADPATWMAECVSKWGTPPPAADSQQTPAIPDAPMPGNVLNAPKDYSGIVDPVQLSKEDVAHLRTSGQFLSVLERYRQQGSDGLPGFGRGKKIPKG